MVECLVSSSYVGILYGGEILQLVATIHSSFFLGLADSITPSAENSDDKHSRQDFLQEEQIPAKEELEPV